MSTTASEASGHPGQLWSAGWATPASQQLTSVLVLALPIPSELGLQKCKFESEIFFCLLCRYDHPDLGVLPLPYGRCLPHNHTHFAQAESDSFSDRIEHVVSNI